MRRVLPDHLELPALDAAYEGLTLPAGRPGPDGDVVPWVALDMVASVDGAATVSGVTADLGGEADHAAFHQLRRACDALLVGAGTVRNERYGPPVRNHAQQQDRLARGLSARPVLVVVSASLSFPEGHPAFSDPGHPPLVVTHRGAPQARASALARTGAEVLRIGERRVDLPAMLAELGRRGFFRVLCEGGPELNGGLLDADLVDELFLTVTPMIAGGDGGRIVTDAAEDRRLLDLVAVHEHDSELLLRYRHSGRRPQL